ncbi:MAG: hypothetical protein R2873_20910 [Caldilineaceae bacterium]
MIRVDERPTLLTCALAAAADPLIGRIRSNGAQKQAEWAFLAQVHAEAGGRAWTDTLLACLADPARRRRAGRSGRSAGPLAARDPGGDAGRGRRKTRWWELCWRACKTDKNGSSLRR